MNIKSTDMNIQEIYALLDKYYMGESSDEEERSLRKYFSEETIPPDLESEKEIFDHFSATGMAPEPSLDFEDRIITALDKAERDDPSFVIKRRLYTVISSAAAILILVGSYIIFSERNKPADTFSDPALAYAETIKILYNVSASLNSGFNALEPVRKLESTASKSMGTISRSTGMIENNLRSLDYFQKAINIVNSPLGTINK